MIIRPEQMQIFSADVEQRFLRQLVAELHQFAPWHAAILGDSGLETCVQFAARRARRYGFTNRGPIRLYLQMVFLLGAEFDSDPLLPWAGRILADSSIDGQTDRATQLYQALGEYLTHVAGPGNRYAKDALRRAAEELAHDFDAGNRDLDQLVFEKLQYVYPEKCRYAGDEAVHASIRSAQAVAGRHAAAGARGTLLFCGLTFAVGHGFEMDPHLPWIRKTLRDPALTEDRLVERLSARVKTYLAHVITHVT